ALSDSILDGVTRRSLLELAPQLGLEPEERRISIEEWREGAASGEIVEAFACGTAAVITPIGKLVSEDFTIDHGEDAGQKTMELRKTRLDIQYGRAEDKNGWLVRLARGRQRRPGRAEPVPSIQILRADGAATPLAPDR